jgi:hypothetical protein
VADREGGASERTEGAEPARAGGLVQLSVAKPVDEGAVTASWFLVRPLRADNLWRSAFGALLVVIAIAGCGTAMTPMASTQDECERAGGKWRSGICERAGGGY